MLNKKLLKFLRIWRWDLWKHKHLGAYLLISVALFGYWLNARGTINSAEIMRLETEKTRDQAIQRNLNKSLVLPRFKIENQIISCKEKSRNPYQMKIERNNYLIDAIAFGTGLNSTFNQAVQDKVNEIIQSMIGIKDVCKMDDRAFGNAQRVKFSQLTKLINGVIDEYDRQLEKLYKKNKFVQVIAFT